MVQLLIDNPLLLLFAVVAIGYPLGRLKIAGNSIGVAAVLFVGLGAGALHPDLKLPEIVYLLGLVLFVYTIGLANGPSFFASFRRKGLRDNLFVLGILAFAAVLALLAARLLGLRPTLAAGMFAGSLTNTPALAGVLDYLKGSVPAPALDQALADPVVAYSITYPIGVLGMLLSITVLQRLWRVDYRAEAARAGDLGPMPKDLHARTVRVTRYEAANQPIRHLIRKHGWDVVFGRVKQDDQLAIATPETRLRVGDLVTVVGTHDDLDRVTAELGEASEERIELDRSELDFRRVFVSNPRVVGHTLRELDLPQQYGAVVTRLRRGDVEFLPHGSTVLELGDRVRVLTHRTNIEAVSSFLGDSYRALSEIDILTFSLGVALGLLVGIVPIPLPGGVPFKLGMAGGPLVVALVLGALQRTGPLVWGLPYSANLTLRQVGLILFLAGVGTRAGYAFVTTVTQGSGIAIFGAGVVITFVVALTTLWIGRQLLHMPMAFLIGVLAGLQTQPAVLGFALERAESDLPNMGYTTVYPVATIAKILFAQLLLTLLV